MKTYTHSKKRVIFQSLFVWLFIGMHLATVIFFLFIYLDQGSTNREGFLFFVIFINLLLGAISYPAYFLHRNYLHCLTSSRCMIKNDGIEFIAQDHSTFILFSEIAVVNLISCPYMASKLPWGGYGYLELKDSHGQSIQLNSYLLDVSDFWKKVCKPRLNEKLLTRRKEAFPLVMRKTG
jgi:hypothetical protein